VIAITDEIYEHIIYDGLPHLALASLEGMHDHTVTIGGMSKTYAVTGWRVGTMIAPPRLTHAFRQIHDYVSIGAAAPLQAAGAFAYRMPRDYYTRLAADYQARRDRLCRALVDVGFTLDPPRGAYYVMADIQAFGATDDVAFARHLVRDVGVATVPGSSFFHDKSLGRSFIRFCFCKKDETLDAAIDRLRKLRVIA
jgi:aminotransferase